VKGQAFDASGNKIGVEFRVNTAGAGAQTLSDVSALSPTEFVVVWVSETGDASGMGVRGQIFSINSPPVITSNGGGPSAILSLPETELKVTTVTATDPDGTALVYSIAGGPDAYVFTIDPQTGVLSFVKVPDFEARADSNGDNTYLVDVAASDGKSTTIQQLAILITNVNEGVEITSSGGRGSATIAALENDAAVTTISAKDIDGDKVVYSITGGADADKFVINPDEGTLAFAAAPDFEAPGDWNGDNVYDVVVSASDGTFQDSQVLAIVVGNVNEAPRVTSDGGGETAAIRVS
jgi:hypothetical protein